MESCDISKKMPTAHQNINTNIKKDGISMANVNSIASVDTFKDYARNGLISLRPHALDGNLLIANYTPMMTFKQPWDNVTLSSRGLIFFEDSGEIVARPFKKFFNFGQSEGSYIDTSGRIEVANKEDGSMGILYLAPDGEYSIATRGSMSSEQAIHATEVYRSRYASAWNPDEDYSFIFEIIYPEGRIVLDYDGLDDLILLGAVNKETGRSVDRETLLSFGWTGPVAEVYPFNTMEEVFAADQERNREGFVIHFLDADERLKVKFEEYLVIHRLLFNLSERRVWEVLSQGLEIDQWLADLPDEFTKEAKAWRDGLVSAHAHNVSKAIEVFNHLSEAHDGDRKGFALSLKALGLGSGIQPLVFGMLTGWDEARVSEAAWNGVRPF